MAAGKNKTNRNSATWKRIISHDLLPVSKTDFYDSEWREWLDRINDGLESESQRLKKLAEDASQEYAEALAEDYWQAKLITNNMYAALIVSVWAKIEHFLRSLCRYSSCFGLPTINKHAKIANYAEYFNDNLNINLQLIKHSKETNFLRIASNAFKHSDGFYHSDSYPIAETLAKKLRISKGQPIKYIDLPIEELILKAGVFCATLRKKTEKAIRGLQ